LTGLNTTFLFRSIIAEPNCRHIGCGAKSYASFSPGGLRVKDIPEVDMSNKILIAVASAILLAFTGLASAQTRIHWQAPHAYGHYMPYANSYYDRTYWDAIAPNTFVRPDPFAGTVWEGVVPY
jgi:hypothetical protein